jgi:hypothetical protein
MNPERTIFRFHGGSWGLGAAMAVVYLDAMPWWIILVAAAGLFNLPGIVARIRR